MGGVSKRTKEKVKDRQLQLEYILATFSAEDILMGKIE